MHHRHEGLGRNSPREPGLHARRHGLAGWFSRPAERGIQLSTHASGRRGIIDQRRSRRRDGWRTSEASSGPAGVQRLVGGRISDRSRQPAEAWRSCRAARSRGDAVHGGGPFSVLGCGGGRIRVSCESPERFSQAVAVEVAQGGVGGIEKELRFERRGEEAGGAGGEAVQRRTRHRRMYSVAFT